MITFSTLGEHGRLGNQLFQYAAIKSLCIDNGWELKLPTLNIKAWHGQQCLLDSFSFKFDKLDHTDIIEHVYHEPHPNIFNPKFLNIQNNTDCVGFFQNIQYFIHNWNQMEYEFELVRNPTAITIMTNIRNAYPQHELVSIHVRRGDVVDQTKDINFFGNRSSIYGKYLEEALTFFEEPKYKFLVFTGGNRGVDTQSDIDWCQKNICVDDRFISIDTKDPIIDFELISHCNHNIMCHSTTFGWWAAFLNKNINPKIIAPKRYFANDQDLIVKGFYPDDFIQIGD